MSRSLPVWVALGAAAVIATVAIVWSVWGTRQANPEGQRNPTFELRQPPDKPGEAGPVPRGLELSGPSVVQTDAEGNTVWSAKSDGEFTIEERERRVVGTNVLWELARGDEAVSVQASRMELGWDTGDVSFDQGAVVTAGANRRFKAKQARYESATHKVICEGGVTWESERFDASAQTLVVDTKDKKIRLRGDVRISLDR